MNSQKIEKLKHKIKCLENHIEHFENLPAEYKYLWDKDWDDMTEDEQAAYYRSTPAAKLLPCNGETTEQYLKKHAVPDGAYVTEELIPLSVAMKTIQKVLDYELYHKSPS